MRKVILSILFAMVILLSGCGEGEPMRYHDFYEYEEELTEIAITALEKYRTQNKYEYQYIYVGMKKETDPNGVEFEVDEELYDLMLRFQENQSSFHFDYIYVGDSYVSFMRVSPKYDIIFSEDGVRPLGETKYLKGDRSINKIKDKWYEIYRNFGLGDH